MAQTTKESFEKAFDEDKQEEFLQQLRMGMRRGAAIDIVFDDPDPERRRCVREYIIDHPDFEIRVFDAEVDATEHVAEALYNAATSGSVAAAKTWLERYERGGKPSEAVSEPSRGPSVPDSVPGAFDELDNVSPIDPRRRRGA